MRRLVTERIGQSFTEKRDLLCARFIKVSKVLKHIEMLDVAIMGIIVVTCAGTAYHKQGRTRTLCGLFVQGFVQWDSDCQMPSPKLGKASLATPLAFDIYIYTTVYIYSL